jgi:threonine dehydratase
MSFPITLDDVRAAAVRIAPHVRRTPMLSVSTVQQPISAAQLFLKLECLQVTGSFKARGAINLLRQLTPEQTARGLVAASGGNHGIAVAYAGWVAGAPTTVYLPHSAPAIKAQKLTVWGAQVQRVGEVFDDADAAARQAADAAGSVYLHPFDDVRVVAGQGTLALEIVADLPDVDTLVIAIGGGGLMSGIGVAVRALKPNVRIIGVEPVGAPTLHHSVAAGQLVTLPRIETVVGTLAPRRSAQLNLDIIQRTVDQIVLVSDDDMRAAAAWLWREMNVAAELSGAAALAAVLTAQVRLRPDERVCVLVCGAGGDGVG